MSSGDHEEAIVAALSRAEAYGPAPGTEVEVLHTHISVLFFVDGRVYKVKRPVDMGFLDYRTLEARRHFCDEEVRLNRRLAPETYLGVVPVRRDAGGTIRVNGEGETIDYAVEMVRLPAERMLSALLERGAVDVGLLDRLIERLVAFHRACPTGPGVDEHAVPAELRRQIEDNLEILATFAAAPGAAAPAGTTMLSPVLLAALGASLRRALEEHAALLEQRVGEGRVREGHGDLHAGNICVTDRGFVIFDRIEFSPRFRCRDVAAEMAFLAMDLDAGGFRGLGRDLIARYAERTGDPALPRLVPLYKLSFACVRGKVACLRAVDEHVAPAAREAARLEALRYLALAGSYLLPPALVVMCGLPASGKSWAAQAIARPLDAVVLRSDVVRKALAGMAPAERGDRPGVGRGIYAPPFTERTYAALREEAAAALARGRTVVVDATSPTAEDRRRLRTVAESAGRPAVVVERVVSPEVARARLDARAATPSEASDADRAVYEHARGRFEPPEEVPAGGLVRVEGAPAAEEIAMAVIEKLLPLCAY